MPVHIILNTVIRKSHQTSRVIIKTKVKVISPTEASLKVQLRLI